MWQQAYFTAELLQMCGNRAVFYGQCDIVLSKSHIVITIGLSSLLMAASLIKSTDAPDGSSLQFVLFEMHIMRKDDGPMIGWGH